MKDRIDARNSLESYLYNMKNLLDDEEKGVSDKISEADKEELESTINEALDWLDETPDAELEDLEDKKKEVEQIANPIMKDLYQQAPQGGPEEDFDFGDDEL